MRKLFLQILPLLLMTPFLAWGQTPAEQRELAKTVDHEALAEVAQWAQQNRQKAYEYARKHNKPTVIKYDNGDVSYLGGITKTGNLIYKTTYNIQAAKTVNTPVVYPFNELQLFLDGGDMVIGVWDGGEVLGSHELLSGKITQKDSPPEISDHATHVTGTMIGKKLSSNPGHDARGMAYHATAEAYDYQNDFSEMIQNQNGGGVLISNHSYGRDPETIPDNSIFGVYSNQSAALDQILYSSPYYLVCVAAGNERNTNLNNGDGGFDLLTGMGTAKNSMVVAAVDPVFNYTGPSSVNMSSFSNWGPTDDRRIKPDISAQGVGVFSSFAHDANGNISTEAYASISGTSMSTPTVSGSLLLLQEFNEELTGNFMKSATLKALAIHSAREAGDTPGPDAKFGWGLLNTGAAAKIMMADDDSSDHTKSYEELTLNNDDTPYTKTITAKGGGTPLKVTIVWTDPAGPIQGTNDTDNTTSRLVNDLDMRLQGDGFPKFPWKLTENNGEGAVTGDNNVDNVEQIVVTDPGAGSQYVIEISHEGSLQFGSQDFSMVITGMQDAAATESKKLRNFTVYPNPADNYFNVTLGQAKNGFEVNVYTLQGRRVIHQQFDGGTNLTKRISTQSLSTGIYFVKVKNNGVQATRKLIIK